MTTETVLTAAPAAAPARFSRGVLPILVVSVLWGGVGLASDLAPAAAPVASLSAAAILLGGILHVLTARGCLRLYSADGRIRALVCLGAVTCVGYQQAFFPAVRILGVAESTVITLGSAPLFAGAITRWVLRRPLSARWIRCAPVAVVGCTLLILGGGGAAGRTHASAGEQALGVALALVPGLAYAITSIVAAALITEGHASQDVMAAMFGGAAVLALPILTLPLLGGAGLGWIASARGAGSVFYLGAVTAFGCYRLFGRALRHTSAATATTLTLTEGAVGALLGLIVRGEHFSAGAWCGLAVLAAALIALCIPGRSAARANRGEFASGS